MKIPYFVGNSLSEFLKSALETGVQAAEDGLMWSVYRNDVEAPVNCPQPRCRAAERLRRNGSYARRVIEGATFLLILIYRFRCRSCGATVSCPPSFLVPYRRFTGRLICQGIEEYGKSHTSYGDVSLDLSVYRDEEQPDSISAAPTALAPEMTFGKDGLCPARSTVFSWVNFVCKRIWKTVQQTEKELVLQGLDVSELHRESSARNANAWKAGKLIGEKSGKHQKEKPRELNGLTFVLLTGESLLNSERRVMEKLRTYFLQSAEKCLDLLSEVSMVLPTAQTSEQLK